MVQAGDASAVPTRVFGSEEDDFTITEYVYDMNAIGPMTKGQEIVTSGTSGHPINNSGESFGVLAYYETTGTPTQPIAAKGLDFDGFCSYSSSSWNWDSSTTQYTTKYITLGVPTNAMTPITTNDDGVLAPSWRIKSTERIWSIYPVSAANRITATGAYTDLKSKISADAPPSFTFDYTVSTTLEDQEDLLFAYNKESRNWKKAEIAPDPRAWEWNDGTNDSFDIRFYHALAAVKFQLSNATTVPEGTNVHSITLCYVDDASKNIVKEVGVARYGECTVTGDDSSAGSCGVGFSWGNLGTKRPLHYTFADTYSAPTPSSSTVAGGYAKSGDGVMFMIPQTIKHTISTTGGDATLKIIVQFSKYGSTDYHTVVKDFTSSDVTWVAGKYYLYKLKIGEFHVPGEMLVANASLSLSHFNTSPTKKVFSSDIACKGVVKIGVYVQNFVAQDNNSSGYSYFFAGTSTSAARPDSHPFPYDFQPTPLATETTIDPDKTYKSGDEENDVPDYDVIMKYMGVKKPTAGPVYWVFDVKGSNTFNIICQSEATNANASLTGTIRGVTILEVEKDTNLDSDKWTYFLDHTSDYL